LKNVNAQNGPVFDRLGRDRCNASTFKTNYKEIKFMGYRLSQIYTRTGDQGTTGLADGSRIDKDAERIEVLGTVDELNCVIGLVLSEPIAEPITHCLLAIQHDLFDLGGEFSLPGQHLLQADHVARLEQYLDQFNAHLPPLKEFVLPRGCRATTLAHLARTVCRRAERRLVSLMRHETINQHSFVYLNRLSDLLFVLARYLGQGEQEIVWDKNRHTV
jgi:cob(I)alamin adenosyltransferase